MSNNMSNILKQAKQMQSKLSSLQAELAKRETEAVSGGGMVKVKVNGKHELVEIIINRECVDPDDVEMLQDLIKIAMNQALAESQEMVSSAMSKITGGLHIPGLF